MSVLQEWIGREATETDVVEPGPVRLAASLFDIKNPNDALGADVPVGWHWFYFNPATPQSDIGDDGHPRRGGLLPPIPLPRRMWAAGRLTFQRAIRIGERIERRSRITSIETKKGRSGTLVFVTVHRLITGSQGPAVEEEQTLVYRRAPGRNEPSIETRPPPSDSEWTETYLPTAVALFRFSALTFNGHRIHYDHPYATGVEGYRGLLVHGPFAALLLLSAAVRHTPGRPSVFAFRNVGPLFADETINIAGRAQSPGRSEVWAANPQGIMAVKASFDVESS